MLKYELKKDSIMKNLDIFDEKDKFIGSAFYLFFSDHFTYAFCRKVTKEELEEIAEMIFRVFRINIMD